MGRSHHGGSRFLAQWLGFRHRRCDMMSMTTRVMVGISLVAIGRNLISIAIDMADHTGAIRVDADDRLHCMGDRSQGKGQENGQTGKKDRQSMHLFAL
jgi:hypothetical protein